MKKILIIILLFISVVCNATTYYVKNGGSDANTGLSNAQALATVAHAYIHSTTGDSILFNRGDTWREQIIPRVGILGAYTYYGAYGIGAKPLFLGSKQENSTDDWVNVGTNLWQNSDAALTVDVGNIVFNNETNCGIKLMTATPTFVTQGQFWYDFVNDRIKMYSVCNPACFYTDIECVLKKDALINLDVLQPPDWTHGVQFVTFQNLDFRYWGMCVWEYGGNYITFKDVDLSYIGGCDQHSDYTVRYGNGLQIWEGIHDITIERCRIDNIYDAGISPQGYADRYEVYNIYMRNNIISNCEYSFEFFEIDATASAHDIYFENNTCVNAGGGWGHNQRPDGVNGAHIMIWEFNAISNNIFIRNNIFFNATQYLFRIGHLSPDNSGINDLAGKVIDYNLYYQSSGWGMIAYKTWDAVNYTLPEWKVATRQEVYSIGDNPLFISTNNFHLQAGSPAISAGVRILSINIGAYEKQ